MNATLTQLEDKLRKKVKFWQYETRVTPGMTDEQKIAIAEQVLAAPLSWAQGVGKYWTSRQYPPGYDNQTVDG